VITCIFALYRERCFNRQYAPLITSLGGCSKLIVYSDDLLFLLQGYKVYYTLTPDLPISLWTVHEVEGSRLTNIPNLLTNRTYSLRVLAFTEVGDGPLSEQMQVKMQQGGIVTYCIRVDLCSRHVSMLDPLNDSPSPKLQPDDGMEMCIITYLPTNLLTTRLC